jgi:hypothetical protein
VLEQVAAASYFLQYRCLVLRRSVLLFSIGACCLTSASC